MASFKKTNLEARLGKIPSAGIGRAFIAGIFENYPEASEGPIECVDFYNKAKNPRSHWYKFKVYDDAGRGHVRVVRFHDMRRGLYLFMFAKARGELAGCPWTREGRGRWFSADYDRTTVDAICQLALFGEVRYG